MLSSCRSSSFSNRSPATANTVVTLSNPIKEVRATTTLALSRVQPGVAATLTMLSMTVPRLKVEKGVDVSMNWGLAHAPHCDLCWCWGSTETLQLFAGFGMLKWRQATLAWDNHMSHFQDPGPDALFRSRLQPNAVVLQIFLLLKQVACHHSGRTVQSHQRGAGNNNIDIVKGVAGCSRDPESCL